MREAAENNESNNSDKIAYQDRNIEFMMEGESVYVGNIVYECFHRSIPMHSHSDNSYEIHYISSGRGRVTVSGKEYDTVPGTLYVTGPHVRHSMIPDPEDPLSEYCVYLKLSEDDRNYKQKGSASPLRKFRLTTMWYGRDVCGLYTLMKSLFSELKQQNIGYRTVVEAIIRQIIIYCVRNYSADEVFPEQNGLKSGDSRFLLIEEAFLYEYATLTLTSLASRLNLSERQTQRLLMEHYGMNFQSKKTEARMSAAALMLRSPDMSVTRIAEDIGYSSVEHFSSAFRKYYNVSASGYRKLLFSPEQRATSAR